MKETFLTLAQWAKEDPKDFILNVVTMVALFGLFYVTMWLGAIIEGRV